MECQGATVGQATGGRVLVLVSYSVTSRECNGTSAEWYNVTLLRGQAIKQWFKSRGAKSPTTGRPLPDTRLVPNNALRSIIQTFSEVQ